MGITDRLGQVVLWGTGVTTLLVTPFFSYDPINIPRFLAVFVFGLMGFFLLLGSKQNIFRPVYRKAVLAAVSFISWAFIVMFASKINLNDGLFGVSGRQTGFLTYFAFIALMLCAILSSSAVLQLKLALILVFAGLISGLYGVVQVLGADPFDWINPYSPVFGFFGNPNFQASFMGMSAVAALALFLGQSFKPHHRVALLLFIALALFNVNKSKSQQGYLVFLVGAVVIGYLFVRGNSKLKKFGLFYVFASVMGFIAVLLDILQKSPWSSILYKESVTFRGDFWRAGWKMTLDHPVFGVGLDGYRDYYRESRDLVTALRPGSDTMTDSAHNVFLDISSGGGFPLLIIYVFLVGLTIFSATKVIRRNKGFDAGFAAIFGSWVAYLAQSIISIGNIGLSVWGWVLMGAIIGYEINNREKPEVKRVDSAYPTVAIGMGLIVGLSIGIPPLAADASFRSSINSREVQKIEASVRQWPQDVTRLTYVAQLFREQNLPDRSIVIAREAVEFNPMNFEAWKELSLQPNATESERAQALETMKKLDPFNPILK